MAKTPPKPTGDKEQDLENLIIAGDKYTSFGAFLKLQLLLKKKKKKKKKKKC